MFWLLLLVTICVCSVYYRWKRRRIYKIYNELPKLPFRAYPVIGHAYAFGISNRDRMTFIKTLGNALVELGGVTSMWMANRLYVCVSDPIIAEVVLKQFPGKDDTMMKILRRFTGNGSIFATGGTYALMSIKTALSTMLRRYRLLPPASLDPQQIKETLQLTFEIMMRHVDNYSLRLEYRNN